MRLLSRPTPQFGTPTTGTDKARILLATTAEIGVTNGRAALAARRHRRAQGLPPGVDATDYDPLDPAVIADPYPAYRRLLAGGPVAYNKRRDLYVISHYDAVREAARADTALSSAEGITRARVRLPMMITMDRPRHTRLRRAVLPGFTKTALQRWTPTIDALAADLVGQVRAAPGTDMVGRLAVPLPVRIIAHVLGIPPEDQDVFRTWSDWIVEGFQLELRPDLPVRFSRSVRGLLRLSGYLQTQLASGRLLDGDGVLGRLQRDTADGTITAEELFWFTTLLLVAGNETTTNLLSTMFLTLAEHREQYALLREQPALVTAAIEEQLRYGSPIQGFYRTATTDYPIGEAVIPSGARVLLLFGAANRDPRRFPDPDTFDVTRPSAQHMAFGSGVHLCLGAHLARAEGQAVLQHLLTTTDHIEVTGRPVWNTNSALRGLHHLPVTLH